MAAAGGKLRRGLHQATLFALRAGSTGSKFLLAIYTARYLALSDLGIYGLLVGATAFVPGVAGLGLSGWIVREVVDLPMARAMPLVATRTALSIAVQAIAQPLVLLALTVAGYVIPLNLALICGAILMLETLANEIHDVLIARQRIFLAHWLAFLRQGIWPLPVIALGVLMPQTRSLEMLLSFWCGALILTCLVLLGFLLSGSRWRHVRLQPRLLPGALRGGLLLYLEDVSNVLSGFADRFLISLFLGLELSGVYSLYWAIANVIHSMVVVGVLQNQVAALISAANNRAGHRFRQIERNLMIEAGGWSLLFAGGLAAGAPMLLALLGRVPLQSYLPVLWLIIAATVIRIFADACHYAIYSCHRDAATALIAFGGAVTSAVLNVVLIPAVGLWGAALAYVMTATFLLVARYTVGRVAIRAVHGEPRVPIRRGPCES